MDRDAYIRTLTAISEDILQQTGIPVWFCEIFGGRRWSYLAGEMQEDGHGEILMIQRREIGSGIGMASPSLSDVPDEILQDAATKALLARVKMK
ncbi:MAG: hypothetical protein CVV64_14015 [Candidatus Wallbacteria bacterium HGW-Wallbacteria-1]|jgi:hypothetical protein|uniref:Uncharacterized protein n=1 Tax=Candidatus Wallbacteria bacterium HGW-Wallbacteria-1 TaxID=2013854 RepID=A0A2N1PMF2_9BACT|nr:MAG: hypothetical protein CVV64_14015 [Candidatus Wallbacteria bacterium HGW-Wallbacteria-1]